MFTAAGADLAVEVEVARGQHRRLGVEYVGTLRSVTAEAGIDQHLTGRPYGTAARGVADRGGEVAAGGVARQNDGQRMAGGDPREAGHRVFELGRMDVLGRQ